MRPEFKPCPFCGSDDVELWYDDPFDGYQGPGLGFYMAVCAGCGARVKRKTKEQAMAAWNRRAADGR